MSKFKKVMMAKTKYIVAVWLFGVALAVLLYVNHANDYLIGFSYGFVGSVSCILILQIIYLIWIHKSDIKLKKETIKYKDERNIFINDKSNAVSFVVFMVTIALLIMIFAFFDQDLSMKYSCILWLGISIKLITYFYYKKKL